MLTRSRSTRPIVQMQHLAQDDMEGRILRTVPDAEGVNQVQCLVHKAELIVPELSKLGVEYDAGGEDPAKSMTLVWEQGLYVLSIPEEFGGLSNNTIQFAGDLPTLVLLKRDDGVAAGPVTQFSQARLSLLNLSASQRRSVRPRRTGFLLLSEDIRRSTGESKQNETSQQ